MDGTKIRISREKKASSLAFFPRRSIQGAAEEQLSREQSKFYSRLPRRSIIYRRNTAEHAPSGEPPQAPTRRYDAADLRVGILPEESISSVVYFFLLCFCLDPKAPKDQARRKAAGDDTCAH